MLGQVARHTGLGVEHCVLVDEGRFRAHVFICVSITLVNIPAVVLIPVLLLFLLLWQQFVSLRTSVCALGLTINSYHTFSIFGDQCCTLVVVGVATVWSSAVQVRTCTKDPSSKP